MTLREPGTDVQFGRDEASSFRVRHKRNEIGRSAFLERVQTTHENQHPLRPRQRHVQPSFIRQKTDRPTAVTPHRADHHHVRFGALETINGVHRGGRVVVMGRRLIGFGFRGKPNRFRRIFQWVRAFSFLRNRRLACRTPDEFVHQRVLRVELSAQTLDLLAVERYYHRCDCFRGHRVRKFRLRLRL